MTLSTHNDPEVTNPMTPQCGWKFRNVDLLPMQIFCHDTLFDQTLPERIAFSLWPFDEVLFYYNVNLHTAAEYSSVETWKQLFNAC